MLPKGRRKKTGWECSSEGNTPMSGRGTVARYSQANIVHPAILVGGELDGDLGETKPPASRFWISRLMSSSTTTACHLRANN